MSQLSWVQPPDLLAHELVASEAEGKDVADVRRRWAEAGGQAVAPVTGLGQHGDDRLRALAVELLDELEALPGDPGLSAREPDDLDAIVATWGSRRARTERGDDLDDRLLGAWTGRAAGCLLGKPVEKIPREGIREILRQPGPLAADRLVHRGGPARRRRRPLAVEPAERAHQRWPRTSHGMPEDDDLNFPMLALDLLERHGPDLTTDQVADAWLANLPGGRVFTAERVAYRNLLLGEVAPRTATRHNPFREWIGAQIRSDVYGWANPGNPAAAARLAWRDARLSHVRNGVYGAMFVAAACARRPWSATTSTPCSTPACRSCRRGAGTPRPSTFGAELGRSRRGCRAGARRACTPATATSTGCTCSTTPR